MATRRPGGKAARRTSPPKLRIMKAEPKAPAEVTDAEQRAARRRSSLLVRPVGYLEQTAADGTRSKALILRLVDKEGNDVVEQTPRGPLAIEFACAPIPVGTSLAIDAAVAKAVGASAGRLIH